MNQIQEILIFVIRLYQKYISPYKGFQCAHACLYNDASCSDAVITIIESNGLIMSLDKIKARFKACREAYLILSQKNMNHKDKPNKKNKNNWYDCCDPSPACDMAECVSGRKHCDLPDLPCDCWSF